MGEKWGHDHCCPDVDLWNPSKVINISALQQFSINFSEINNSWRVKLFFGLIFFGVLYLKN